MVLFLKSNSYVSTTYRNLKTVNNNIEKFNHLINDRKGKSNREIIPQNLQVFWGKERLRNHLALKMIPYDLSSSCKYHYTYIYRYILYRRIKEQGIRNGQNSRCHGDGSWEALALTAMTQGRRDERGKEKDERVRTSINLWAFVKRLPTTLSC